MATALEPEAESTMSDEQQIEETEKRMGWKQTWQLHAERARDRGILLGQYCRERNLSVHSLYSARYQFSKSRRQSGAAVRKQSRLGKFVEVQVSPTEPTSASMACRVCVKGCVIESCVARSSGFGWKTSRPMAHARYGSSCTGSTFRWLAAPWSA